MLGKHTNVPHNKVGPGQWVRVQLGELNPKSVFDCDNHLIWCSVQVEAMVVGDVKLDMDELDCHISIGTWFTHPSDEGPSWNFQEAHERWEDSLLGGPGWGRGIRIGIRIQMCFGILDPLFGVLVFFRIALNSIRIANHLIHNTYNIH